MLKQVLYKYLGTNGVIVSPVHLEDIYYVRNYHLIADPGKQLTKDDVHFCSSVTIPEQELEQWHEVEIQK